MIKLTAGEESFKIKNSWNKITFREYQEIQRYFNENIPEKLRELYEANTSEEKQTIMVDLKTNKNIVMFQVGYVSLFTKADKSLIMQLPRVIKEGIGLDQIFETLVRFAFMPVTDEITVKDNFKFKNKTYMVPETYKRPDGVEELMRGETAQAVTEAYNFMGMFQENPLENRKMLVYLCSTICRPVKSKYLGLKNVIKPYDEEDMMKRAEVFKDLTMDKIWSAYFFFVFASHTIQKDGRTYSGKAQ